MLMAVSGCGTVTAPTANPFCLIVGPPPASMIPAEGEPFGWIDSYLAIYDEVCD